MRTVSKRIVWFGTVTELRCDGRCDKAWGINGRPRTSLGSDPDDYVYKRDSELASAPGPGLTVGLSEGGDMKPSALPITDGAQMNKWCARECERSVFGEDTKLPNLEEPRPNMRQRHGQ